MTQHRTSRSVGELALDDVERDLLNRLRLTALRCRSAAFADIFDTCAEVSNARDSEPKAIMEATIRCLPQALGRPLRMLRPGVREVSFDEAWLLQLIRSACRRDEDSFRFLLQSRVQRHARRSLGYLTRSMSERVHRI